MFGAVAEVAEAGKIIQHSGSRYPISAAWPDFGQMEQLLRQVDGYRMNGMDVACDCYPYFAFSTRIGATTYDDGWLERYHCDYECLPADGRQSTKDSGVRRRPLRKCAETSRSA